jgi:hypothetical protein
MWTSFLWMFTNNMTWSFIILAKIFYTLFLLLLFNEGLEYRLINLHGIILLLLIKLVGVVWGP